MCFRESVDKELRRSRTPTKTVLKGHLSPDTYGPLLRRSVRVSLTEGSTVVVPVTVVLAGVTAPRREPTIPRPGRYFRPSYLPVCGNRSYSDYRNVV